MAAALTSVTADEATDAAVIEASRRDPALFGVLYDRYAAQLYRYAHRRLGAQLAEDVVAEAFAAAFTRRDRYNVAYEDARPWLFGILTKEIGTQRRREVAHNRMLARSFAEVTGDDLADRVSAEVTARAAHGRLSAALAGLSAGDRDVLLLVAWGDLRYEEVAYALAIPVGTVRHGSTGRAGRSGHRWVAPIQPSFSRRGHERPEHVAGSRRRTRSGDR
ncbi:RNA polymerase sigma factor [Dactylosporangium sp. NPDC051485]|uniref:RNA polymerase sigma factor n=1 Tax=Dactylosporangium sp. NPDC051485 TaxID=3154846 RepID=UPI00341F8990